MCRCFMEKLQQTISQKLKETKNITDNHYIQQLTRTTETLGLCIYIYTILPKVLAPPLMNYFSNFYEYKSYVKEHIMIF